MAIQPQPKPAPKLIPAEEGKSAKETREARFSRMASHRTTRAVKAIRALGALSGPQFARASQTQLAKIESHLTNEVRTVVERLRLPVTRGDIDQIEI